jgi:hypothetical protein
MDDSEDLRIRGINSKHLTPKILNWGALPELIMDEENGFLVYYQDVEANNY